MASRKRSLAAAAALLALTALSPAVAETLVESDGIVYRAGAYNVGGALQGIDRQAAAAQGLLDPQLRGLLGRQPRATPPGELFRLGEADGLQLRGGTGAARLEAPAQGRDQHHGANLQGDRLDVGLYAELLFESWRVAATMRHGLGGGGTAPSSGTADLSYGFTPLEGLEVRVGPTLNWANGAYAAQPPGLQSWTGSRLFHLGETEGWRDVGFSVSASWELFDNWAVDSTLGVARPLSEPGAAAQDETHGFGLLGIRYRF